MILSNNAVIVQNMARQFLLTVPIFENKVNTVGLHKSELLLVHFAVEAGWLSTKLVREALHMNLLNTGRQSFDQHINDGVYPDHTCSPHALAYAMAQGSITHQEAGTIKFDHDDTIRSFYVGAEKQLLEEVWSSLVDVMFASSSKPMNKGELNNFIELEKTEATA